MLVSVSWLYVQKKLARIVVPQFTIVRSTAVELFLAEAWETEMWIHFFTSPPVPTSSTLVVQTSSSCLGCLPTISSHSTSHWQSWAARRSRQHKDNKISDCVTAELHQPLIDSDALKPFCVTEGKFQETDYMKIGLMYTSVMKRLVDY